MGRDSKEWRRSSLAPLSFEPQSRSHARSRLRSLLALTALATLSLVVYVVRTTSPSALPSPLQHTLAHTHFAKWTDGQHPQIDDEESGNATAALQEDDGEETVIEGEEGEEGDEEGAEVVVDDDAMDDDGEEWEGDVRPSHDASTAQKDLPPFIPFSCQPCSTSPSSLGASFFPSTCQRYRTASFASPSSLHPAILDHSVLFPGTGDELRRVLRRAVKSSMYGVRRSKEWRDGDERNYEDEEPFRILVLGGSVSNCRGVDLTACWHSRVLRWFQQTLPMEGDRNLVPELPSLLFPSASISTGPSRHDTRQRDKRALQDEPVASLSSPSSSPVKEKRSVKGKKSRKKKGKQAKAGSVPHRRLPSIKVIQGSKSATGSAFFASCFDSEMTLRRKNVDWGLGPDLVIVETGVNDVWPGGEQATRDYENLLRKLRSLPSKPAVVALEAASLLLASTGGMTANAEYDHLPAAHFYDVPVLSAKHALFGPLPFHSSSSPASLSIDDFFLSDLHHPNERGHELLSDILVSFLEQQACLVQSEILSSAEERIRVSNARVHASLEKMTPREVDPELDFGWRRKDEPVRPLPARSLFTPFSYGRAPREEEAWEMPESRCIQVGNAKELVEPIRNNGWSKLAWARDKQYLVADSPGASVTFAVEVGKGGTILVDWLHSRFYDLGNVAVYLDGDPSSALFLAGFWDLGWSIGVPTELFTAVAPGTHEVTFELLPSSQSSHPKGKTHFRLIGLIST